ncbi:MAG TPA: hypothetical protein VG652_06085 [Gaiellaceae bacterium]|nr:hypothetical protein [Gaiellaceae bacterium]
MSDGAVVIAVLALIAAASQTPVIARYGWSHLNEHVPSTTDRELAAVVYSQAPNSTFLDAARIIPRNALYSVVVGEDPPNPAGFDVAIPGMFQYWLLPRRFTKNIHKAQWVISWHHSSETLGIRYSEELPIGLDVNVLKVIP